MPSVLIQNQSGGYILVSGHPWSGHVAPQGLVKLKLDPISSGNVYIGLSGGVTARSGGINSSGESFGGLLDGYPLAPGDTYEIPKIAFPSSGTINIYVVQDAATSGRARLSYEVF